MDKPRTYSIPGVRAQTYRLPALDVSKKKKSKKSKSVSEFFMEDPAKILSDLLNLNGLTPAEKAARITIWNRVEQRKIAGTAAPLRRNLAKYVFKHQHCDVYVGQDKFDAKKAGEIDRKTGNIVAEVTRVTMWNPIKKTKVTGNAAPLPKNLRAYFARNPGMEVYRGQDLKPEDLDVGSSEHHQSQIRGKLQSQTKISAQKESNSPGIHYPLITFTHKMAKFEWEGNTDEELPLHIFHDTHEIVPDSYWTGKLEIPNHKHPATSSESTGSTALTLTPASPLSYVFTPFGGGNPIFGTDEHDFTNLDRISYDEMASSWSNSQMWIDPNCQYKLEPEGTFVTAILADRSLVCDETPLDLTVEAQDFPMVGCVAQKTSYSPPGLSDASSEEIQFDDVDLSFDDIFAQCSEADAEEK